MAAYMLEYAMPANGTAGMAIREKTGSVINCMMFSIIHSTITQGRVQGHQMATVNYSKTRIDSERLWSSLMEMAEIGKTPRGGCNRQALTPEDRLGRDLFVSWCEAAGCAVTIDTMGNVFARRPGADDSLPPVIAGSHLDTQPTGGKFDGVYGVLAGLEVIRTLNDHGVETRHPLEVVSWTNEEGARFPPAMLGSGVWAGTFDLEYGHNRTDKEGKTIKDELERIGYLGAAPCRARPLRAAFEVHIEQGPILEHEGLTIGIVNGVQAIGWYDLIIGGVPCHAGTTPMEVRRDPFMALHGILDKLYQVADDFKPLARITFGDIRAEPGARNTVPERVVVTVDLRHPDRKQVGTWNELCVKSSGMNAPNTVCPEKSNRNSSLRPSVLTRSVLTQYAQRRLYWSTTARRWSAAQDTIPLMCPGSRRPV